MIKNLAKNIILTIILSYCLILVPGEVVLSQNLINVSSNNKLPVASVSYCPTKTTKQNWKMTSKDRSRYENNNYIKRPYHNPNLITELKQQRLQEQARKEKEAKIAQKNKRNEILEMCFFAANSRRMRSYTQGGPTIITHRQVFSRKVVSASEYKDVCVDFYKKNSLYQSNSD